MMNRFLIYVAAAIAVFAAAPAQADRMALWRLVHDQCAPHSASGAGPKPCEAVDIAQGEARGFAVLKDRNGVAQMLAIPTARVTGIEDPALLAPGAANYFVDAWAARDRLDQRLGHPLPREAVGVTVNSMFSRSQDQLHLHIDCLDKAVAAEIAAEAPGLDAQWRPMGEALKGRRYWARRLDESDLAKASPFLWLADGLAGARLELGLWSLALVGAEFDGKPGFVLLADHAELTAGGHAEDLQDHSCAVAAKP